ncbi:putative sodium-coupled monocarboxylate transporter 2-like [Apostichopus japonicus]|uniref:Putative sodium-coupled monocarboxylate transporter 2-like n=1 Tax=Stichopus japonicus TaxID=307972 RepID=A0A2G8KAM8_STIJA|nr:putative sodium-coupled monocarboxylate transporter 2-like [Apostichopus japonicus]
MSTRVSEGGRSLNLNFDLDITIRYTVYSSTLGGIFSAFTTFTTGQPIIQRCLCCKTLPQAQAVIWIGFVLSAFTVISAVIAGLFAYAYYADCDPRRTGRIQRFDQLVPLIIGDIFGRYPGMAGFIVSGAFSASLSTISSSLNSMTAVLEAAVLGRMLKDSSDKRLTFLSKLFTFAFGLLCTAVALLATKLSGVLEETIALVSILVTPLSAVFFLGFFVPRCNSKGALSGLVAGILFGVWIKLGSEIYPITKPPPFLSIDGCPSANVTSYVTELYENTEGTTLPDLYSYSESESVKPSAMVTFYNMSLFFYSACTFTVSLVVAYIVSLATKAKPCHNPALQMSILEPFYCGDQMQRLLGKTRYVYTRTKTDEVSGDGNVDAIDMDIRI